MLNLFSLLWRHVYTSRMKPIGAAIALNHQVIGIVRHLTLAVYGDSIGVECSSGRIILETAKVIVVTNGVKLSIAFESVNSTLAFDCIGALYIVVIGEENLFGAVKLSPATDRFLWSVVPLYVNFNVGPFRIRFELFHFCYIRGLG